MSKLTWNKIGENFYETGIARVVLYPMDDNGDYQKGVAWNGVTLINEVPSGGEVQPLYNDGVIHANYISLEEYQSTLEAFTYPEEFSLCDGIFEPSPGVILSQQSRKSFGLAYSTILGNDLRKEDHGYKLHLVYGALASPSERSYQSINDSASSVAFSWNITTIAIEIPNFMPIASLVIDSTKANSNGLASLEQILYGISGRLAEPHLPLPDEVLRIFAYRGAPSINRFIRFRVGYTAIGEGAIS